MSSATASASAVIPRLGDVTDAQLAGLQPRSWQTAEVTQFLRSNDCAVHADAFARYAIDGAQLLQLSKDEIITMLDKKVGPALRIFDLVQQLKARLGSSGGGAGGLQQASARQKAAGGKRAAAGGATAYQQA